MTLKERIEYQTRLLKVRQTLDEKGIFKPIKLMKEQKLLRTDKDYNNLLSGRVRNEEFLLKFEKFSEQL